MRRKDLEEGTCTWLLGIGKVDILHRFGEEDRLAGHLKEVDTIFYFDFPRLICLYRVVKRRIQHRGQTRADMGEGCKEKIDLEFLKWIWYFKKRNQHRMEILLREARLNKRQVIVFKKPKEVQAYLAKLAAGEEKTVHDG